MKPIYFTVGPSQLYPTVTKHVQQAMEKDIMSILHRGAGFADIYKDVVTSLRTLLNLPEDVHIFFTGSSLESMERTIQNCVDEKSFHVVTGSFGKKWYMFSEQLKKHPTKYEMKFGEGVDLATVQVPKDIELICVTQNDTTTGVAFTMESIAALKKRHKNALLAIDMVSSAPYFNVDFNVVDVAFFSVQKGFGLPAGLGVLLVKETALERANKLQKAEINIGTYHNFLEFAKMETKFETPETPNVFTIFLLSRVLHDMLNKGIASIRRETEEKAEVIYRYFDTHKEFKPLVNDQRFRSKTTIVIDVNGKSQEVIKKLTAKGLRVNKGYGDFKDQHIRIGVFPAHTIEQVRELLFI